MPTTSGDVCIKQWLLQGQGRWGGVDVPPPPPPQGPPPHVQLQRVAGAAAMPDLLRSGSFVCLHYSVCVEDGRLILVPCPVPDSDG